MVERIEMRSVLDGRQDAHDTGTKTQNLDQPLYLRARPDDADDEVEQRKEAGEEHESLDDLGVDLELINSLGVRNVREHACQCDDQDWAFEACRAGLNAWVDEQGNQPPDNDKRENESIGLEIERHVPRQAVALDRDEEDNQHDQRYKSPPLQEPVMRVDERNHQDHRCRDDCNGWLRGDRNDENQEGGDQDGD